MADNFLVECHECHNMYHQKCHEPHVPKSQISDPRLLWFCHQCDNMNRQRTTTSEQSSSASSGGKSSSAAKESQKSKANAAQIQSSKRGISESKAKTQTPATTSAWTTASSTKPTSAGLFSMAADFLAKHKPKTAAGTPSKITPPSTALSGATNPFAMALSSASSGSGLSKLSSQLQTSTSGLSKLANTVMQSVARTSTNVTSSSSVQATATAANNAGATAGKPQTLPSTQMQAAEKRLQMMKKKAASKGSFK